jgi:hypothetical protein
MIERLLNFELIITDELHEEFEVRVTGPLEEFPNFGPTIWDGGELVLKVQKVKDD